MSEEKIEEKKDEKK
jgi:hypothetical protein